MPESITTTYIGINPIAIRDKLGSTMAICLQPERTERHQLYDIINSKSHVVTGYVELQVEVSRITLTYHPLEKKSSEQSGEKQNEAGKPKDITGELKMGVSDFDTACQLLAAMGMHARSFEETKREIWSLGNASVAIDTWPWLDPFVTITAPTDKDVEEAAAKLEIKPDQKYESNVAGMYKDAHGIDESVFFNTPKLMFMSRPDWIKWEDPPKAEEAKPEEGKDGAQPAESQAPPLTHTADAAPVATPAPAGGLAPTAPTPASPATPAAEPPKAEEPAKPEEPPKVDESKPDEQKDEAKPEAAPEPKSEAPAHVSKLSSVISMPKRSFKSVTGRIRKLRERRKPLKPEEPPKADEPKPEDKK